MLNPTRLLLDLQYVNEIAQRISGVLDSATIAHQVTDGLIEWFDCAFARIWLIEPDRQTLKLVASSGLYTHTNGSFARVPMGAYKVGKIAQNRVPFLSNRLADESWVKDRDWAIANNIQGFAGYPLAIGNRVIGVLAAFSHRGMAPEFLEMLQVLCMTATVALDAALNAEKMSQHSEPLQSLNSEMLPLSDQISSVLTSTQLMLLGTEYSLSLSSAHALLRLSEILANLRCNYCRLIYLETEVTLEAIATLDISQASRLCRLFRDVEFLALCLGGTLKLQFGEHQDVLQIKLTLPAAAQHPKKTQTPKVMIQCEHPVMQIAVMHLANLAELDFYHPSNEWMSENNILTESTNTNDYEQIHSTIIITDDERAFIKNTQIIWVRATSNQRVPAQATAAIDLSIKPMELKRMVEHLHQGSWEPNNDRNDHNYSEREQEVMQLLAQGMRDRDIAQTLFISESTVKFHINNSLTKLNAKNRYEGVYQAAIHGWI